MADAADAAAATLSDSDRNLFAAVEQNDVAAVQQAIRNECANVDCVRRSDQFHTETPLTIASKFGYDDIARILLDAGANARWKDSHGWSAILPACGNGHFPIVEMLLNHDSGLLDIGTSDGGHGQTSSIIQAAGARITLRPFSRISQHFFMPVEEAGI